MKRLLLIAFFGLVATLAQAQQIFDIKTKNNSNKADRTMMLDILRAKLYEEYKMELVFVVDHFKTGNNYAWLKANAQRKDNKKIELPEDEPNDCCHVECLFMKKGNKWYIVESAAFSTDVWWAGIEERYPDVPKEIFKE